MVEKFYAIFGFRNEYMAVFKEVFVPMVSKEKEYTFALEGCSFKKELEFLMIMLLIESVCKLK
jgi:hypothetical protein